MKISIIFLLFSTLFFHQIATTYCRYNLDGLFLVVHLSLQPCQCKLCSHHDYFDRTFGYFPVCLGKVIRKKTSFPTTDSRKDSGRLHWRIRDCNRSRSVHLREMAQRVDLLSFFFSFFSFLFFFSFYLCPFFYSSFFYLFL